MISMGWNCGVNMPGSVTVLPKEPQVGVDSGAGKGNDDGRIRCPLCKWEPGRHDRWMCHCRHTWNTFDTGGVCPKCLYQWKITACLRCLKFSAHSDWYPKG
jgi:hypothetical protein